MSDELIFSGEDWFSRHEVLWQPIIELVKPKRILEIGSYEGRSTCFIIKECSKYNPIEVYCIDTWLGGQEHVGQDFKLIEANFNHNINIMIKNTNHPVTIYKHTGYSVVELSRLILECASINKLFDLIYVDGSHEASDVFLDAAMSFQLLKVGGVLIFDDYRIVWNNTESEVYHQYAYPKIAIDAFIDTHKNKMEVIMFDDSEGNKPITEDYIYQKYLRKIRN